MDSKSDSRNEQPKRAVFCGSEFEHLKRTLSLSHRAEHLPQPSPPSDPSERPWMTTVVDEQGKQNLMTNKEKQSYEQQV